MSRARFASYAAGIGALFFLSPFSLPGQTWISPSHRNPLAVACPAGLSPDPNLSPRESWFRGRKLANADANQIGGDAADYLLGTENLGHARQILDLYCKAWAGGNPVAAFDIADMLHQGYSIYRVLGSGEVKGDHYLADPEAAFYWYTQAAEHDYTKAMLTVAQYYGAGELVQNSPVRRDPEKALDWLKRAAEKDDTDALRILASLYGNLKTVPWWAKDISVTPDPAKAQSYRGEITATLEDYAPNCTNPEFLGLMIRELPDASAGRRIQSATIVAAHGIEATCMLSLSAPPKTNESPFEKFSRILRGGSVNSWAYSLVDIPGNDHEVIILRETTTEAIIQGIEEMAAVLQAVIPAATASAPAHAPGPVDLNGVWEMRYKDSTNTTRTVQATIRQMDNYLTMTLSGISPAFDMFAGTVTDDKSVVGRAVRTNPKLDSPGTFQIDGPGRMHYSNGDEWIRVTSPQ